METRTAEAGDSATPETRRESAPTPADDLAPGAPDYGDLSQRISAILRTADEAAEAIISDAVELAEQIVAEAQERVSAEFDAVRRDVESLRHEAAAARAEADDVLSARAAADAYSDRIRREAGEAAAATRAAAEEEALHIHEVTAGGMRQLAEDIASHRQGLERAARVFEEPRLASDIEPAERITRGPVVAALPSGSASALARERAVETMVELAIAIVLGVAFVAAMLALLVVLT